MSRKGKRLLKVVGVLYLAAVCAFLYSTVYGRNRRERPELRSATLQIRPRSEFTGWHAEERYQAAKKEIVNAGYRLRAEVAGLETGQPVGAPELERLIEANVGRILVYDTHQIRGLAEENLLAGEELRDANDVVLARVGDELDAERLYRMAVEYDSPTAPDRHEIIWVKGSGSIIGFDLTLVFTGLNFLALIALLYAFLWEPVVRVLDDRAAAVRADVDLARTQRAEAEGLRRTSESELARIRADADRLRGLGRREGETEKARILEEAREEARRLAERTQRATEAEAESARREMAGQIGEISAALAARMLEREVTAADHEALVNEFVRSLDAEAPRRGGDS